MENESNPILMVIIRRKITTGKIPTFFILLFYSNMVIAFIVVIRVVRVRVVMLFAKTGHGDNELSFDLLSGLW